MSEIFLSYSRRDEAFTHSLRDALRAAQRDVWLDKTDIPATAAWLSEIYAAIDAASAVIVVLSPDYVASDTCAKELARALDSRKKLIPVVCREVDPTAVNPDVRALNWIFARTPAEQSQALPTILQALDTDLDYVRSGAKWLVRAREWETRQRNASFALQGKALAEAEGWVVGSGGKLPPPAPLALEYINASRVVERRRQRRTVSSLTAGIIVTLVLAILSTALYGVTLQQKNNLAQQQRQLNAKALAGTANDAILNGDYDRGLLLANAAYGQANLIETRSALVNALDADPHLALALNAQATPQQNDEYQALMYSSDGATLMATNAQTGVELWDMTTHQRTRTIVPPGLRADSGLEAALSPDARMVATKADGSAILWDATTGEQISSATNLGYDFPQIGPSVLFSHDSQMLAFSTEPDDSLGGLGEEIYLVNFAQQTELAIPLNMHGNTFQTIDLGVSVSLAFSPDNSMLAALACQNSIDLVCRNPRLLIYSTATTALLRSVPVASPNQPFAFAKQIAFSADGHTIAIGGCEQENCSTGLFTFYDVRAQQFQPSATARVYGQVESFAYSPDGKWIVFVGGSNVQRVGLVNVALHTQTADIFKGHTSFMTSVAFSPDGKHFVTAGQDGKILMWRLGFYTDASPLVDDPSLLAYSPDGKTLATGGQGTVILWNATNGQRLRTIPIPGGVYVADVAFSPDGKTLATGDRNAHVALWDVASGTEIAALQSGVDKPYDPANLDYITGLAFSPDGKWLVASNHAIAVTQTTVLWNVATRQPVQAFATTDDQHLDVTPRAAAFDARSSRLAVTTRTGTIVWDLAAGKQIQSLREGDSRAAVFDQVGDLATITKDGIVRVWRPDATGPFVTLHDTLVTDYGGSPILAFNPAGDQLLVGHDLSATLWDWRHATKFINTLSLSDTLLNAQFSPDGVYLAIATASDVEIRYARLPDWLAQNCAVANRNLSRAEWAQYVGGPYQRLCPALPVPNN